MRMKLAAMMALLWLAACGADGPPLRPGTDEPGLKITGEGRFGVSTRL